MLRYAKLVAFVATARPIASRAFYENVLGLPVVEDHEFATVYDAGGISLRLQKVLSLAPQPFTQIGWDVKDIANVIAALLAANVTPERFAYLEQDALGIWTTEDGAQIAWFKDPDGNVLSLTQLPPPAATSN